jgi:hypothetical protein
MSCNHYWRDGIVLVEHGEPDPHREGCVDCRRAHTARNELVRAIAMADPAPRGDSDWQARVWQEIAGDRMIHKPPQPSRWWWSLAPALALCAALVIWLRPPDPVRPTVSTLTRSPASDCVPCIEIISGPVVKRSTSARVGDRVRISARRGDDIRVYRAEQLVMRSTAKAPSADCVTTDQSIVAETAFTTAGEYQLVVIKGMVIEPVGSLSADLAPVIEAGGDPQLTDLSIR